MTIIFWAAVLITFYTYLGYGALVWVLLRLRGKRAPARNEGAEWPAATLVVAAYNEAGIIEEKIANSRALDYPEGRLHILVVTDGSDDDTPALVARHPDVRLLHQKERRGKMAAVRRAMPFVQTPVTVFTDANTLLNPPALRRLLTPFADPGVGAVAGEKRIQTPAEGPANAAGESLYWKYESFLKEQDARLGSVVGAAGELYAIRTRLFQPIPDDTILDDFCQTLGIAMAGYRVDYTPDAYAEEAPSADSEEELKRKIRICSGGFQAIARLRPLLNPFRYGMLSFQYISHRVLRWTLAPLLLPLLLISNAALAWQGSAFFQAVLGLQALFYLLAFLGYRLRRRPAPFPGFFVPFYFTLMNYSVYAGFWRFIRRRQSVTWEKARRMEEVGSCR